MNIFKFISWGEQTERQADNASFMAIVIFHQLKEIFRVFPKNARIFLSFAREYLPTVLKFCMLVQGVSKKPSHLTTN